MLDLFIKLNWQPGRKFTRKEILAASSGILSGWTIRKATDELASICGFFPPSSLQHSMGEKHSKNGRPSNILIVPNMNDLATNLGVTPMHYDPINIHKMNSAANYRAEVYAAIPRRKPGKYPRKFLTQRVGVTPRTGRSYDKRSDLQVTPNFDKKELSQNEINLLPIDGNPRQKFNEWLEDEHGKRYCATKSSVFRMKRNGGKKIFLVKQLANTYEPKRPSA